MDKLEKILAWTAAILIPGGLVAAGIVSNSAGSNNPSNIEPTGALGETGVFGQNKNIAQFSTLMFGVARASKNVLRLNNEYSGSTYYQLAQIWATGQADGKPDYGQTVIDTMGVDQNASPSSPMLPWEVSSFLQGIYVGEGSDPVNPVTQWEGVLLGYLT